LVDVVNVTPDPDVALGVSVVPLVAKAKYG